MLVGHLSNNRRILGAPSGGIHAGITPHRVTMKGCIVIICTAGPASPKSAGPLQLTGVRGA